MIIIKSNYSPTAAADKLEEDNVLALRALMFMSGLETADINAYRRFAEQSAQDYMKALGDPQSESGEHTQEQWDKAVQASKDGLDKAETLLELKGITIENKLIDAVSSEYFPHIETTLYCGFGEMQPVAKIERAITDEEHATYENNKTGWGARNA